MTSILTSDTFHPCTTRCILFSFSPHVTWRPWRWSSWSSSSMSVTPSTHDETRKLTSTLRRTSMTCVHTPVLVHRCTNSSRYVQQWRILYVRLHGRRSTHRRHWSVLVSSISCWRRVDTWLVSISGTRRMPYEEVPTHRRQSEVVAGAYATCVRSDVWRTKLPADVEGLAIEIRCQALIIWSAQGQSTQT